MSRENHIRHSQNVGTVRDLGAIDELPPRPPSGAGSSRQANPFDEGVALSYSSGKPRMAYADNLDSAAILIRRAAMHRGWGATIVPTEADDGTPVLAYLVHPKLPGRGPGKKLDRSTTADSVAPTVEVAATPEAPTKPNGRQTGRRRTAVAG